MRFTEVADTLQLVHVRMYYENGEYDDLYTKTDGNGNYPLSNDDSVFWASEPNNPNLNTLDGKPSNPNPEEDSAIFMTKPNTFAVYDDNFKQIGHNHSSLEDAMQDFEDIYGHPYRIL